MKQLRILKATFDINLAGYEIPAFRGSFIEAVGRDRELLHNHNNKDKNKRLHYRYPLVQYKLNNNKPMLVFLDEGVEEAHGFFGKDRWEIRLNGEPVTLKIDRLDLNQFNLQVWDKQFYYNLYKWQALNQKNFEEWLQMESLADKIQFLESKLTAHILSFCKGVGCYLDKRLEVKVLDIIKKKNVRFKGINVATFDVSFKTNIFLPEFIGLGKGVSHGFGILRTKKQARQRPKRQGERSRELKRQPQSAK